MRKGIGPQRRVVRGDVLRPGRYWTVYMAFSFIVHAFMLVVLSGAAQSFMQSLPRPGGQAPPMIYVGLVFSAPSALGKAVTLPTGPASADKPSTSDVIGNPPEAGPASTKASAEGLLRKDTVDDRPAPPAPSPKIKPPTRTPTPLRTNRRDVTRPVRKADTLKTQPKAHEPEEARIGTKENKPIPRSPEEPAPRDNTETIRVAETADRKYVEFFEPDDDAVTLFKGTEKTVLAKSELEDNKVAPAPKPPAPVTVPEASSNPETGAAPPAHTPFAGSSTIMPAPEPEQFEPEPLSDHSISLPFVVPEAFAGVFALPAMLSDLGIDTDAEPSEAQNLPEYAGYTTIPVTGVMLVASLEKGTANTPTEALYLFRDADGYYLPGDNRPAALRNLSLSAAGPVDVPDFSLQALPWTAMPPALMTRSIPVLMNHSIQPVFVTHSIPPMINRSITPATEHRLPEPEPRPAPKIIEVADYQGESAAPPEISIHEPASGDTDRSLVEVKGGALGEGVRSVIFSVGGVKRELLVRDGMFETTVALAEGRNVLKAAATDSYGRAARDRVVVNYVAPVDTGPIISFITPSDGGIIDALRSKEVEVSGIVKGTNVGSVRVYLNKTISDVTLVDGGFRMTRLLESEDNTLYAEATSEGGVTYKSEEVHFRAVNLFPKDLTVRMVTEGAAGRVRLARRWRTHPLSAGAGGQPPVFMDSSAKGGQLVEVEAAEGIFTVGADYELEPGESASVTFHVTLYGHDPSRKKLRSIGPLVLRGRGYLPAVRVLLPEAVFWEDDYWFSGMIESSSGTTKFRQPEGISWTEKD